MKICFLGTGASDWMRPGTSGELRRTTSTLLDETLLIDVTQSVLDMISDKTRIRDVFFTHSHADHFNLAALAQLAPCRVYAHSSWAHIIAGEGLEVIALECGVPVTLENGTTLLPMPSNHSTTRTDETTLHYLIERDGKRLLYATDGAWLLNSEHRLIGERTLDAAVFDATIGDGVEGDWRIFEHNSVDMVRLMVRTMTRTGRLKADAPVFLTHLSRTLHGDQKTIESRLERPLIACYDGLTVEI